ncbi:MAG: TIGR04157 family glycosyltransferase [Bacteroidales bacterium]|nr:TIGR04157 family glycosyltransferase [Bacteroidales bacterium]
MRIYIISDQSSRAGIYGVGTYVRSLGRCAASCGYSYSIVHLVSDVIDPYLGKDEEGVNHYFLPGIEGTTETSIYFKSVVYTLRDLVGDNGERALFHLNAHLQHQMVCELRYLFPNCLILYSIHYFNWIFSLSGSTNYLKEILSTDIKVWGTLSAQCIRDDFRQEQVLFRDVDRVLCLSRFAWGVVTEIAGIETNQLSLIYNGLNDQRKTYSKDELLNIRKKYCLDVSEKIILFAGRLDQVKGVVHIIKAYKELKKEYPDCHLVVVGEGDFSYYLEIAEETCGSILFTGRLEQAKLYELYSIADVGVMQSFHEQCSYVGIEMMMHGLPIIGTNSSGLDEMIIEGETGLKLSVIEQNYQADVDINLLKETLFSILQNDEMRALMSRKARERYEKVYSEKAMERAMRIVYESL